MNKNLILTFILLACFSCSNDDYLPDEQTKEREEGIGRFDSKPFTWDEEHASQKFNKGTYKLVYLPSSINSTTRRGYRDGRRYNGQSSYRNTTNRRRYTNSTQPDPTILVRNPAGIYLSGVYPLSSIKKGLFDQPLFEERNPVRLIFQFGALAHRAIWREYIDEFGYSEQFENAVTSEKYRKYLPSGFKQQVSYQMTEVYSYTDVEKAFGGSTGISKIFSAKIATSKKQIKESSKTLINLTGISFSATMATPGKEGLFKDTLLNSSPDLAYIYRIGYGRLAYAFIESSYSYTEVSKAFKAALSYKFLSADMSADKKTTEVLNASKFVLYTLNDDFKENYYVDDLKALANLFQVEFNEYSPGVPICLEMRAVKENATVILPQQSSSYSEPRPSIRRRQSR